MPPDYIVTNGNQGYKIKNIDTHKKTKGMTVYQVRWQRYDAMEDSWLREGDLFNTFELLQAY